MIIDVYWQLKDIYISNLWINVFVD